MLHAVRGDRIGDRHFTLSLLARTNVLATLSIVFVRHDLKMNDASSRLLFRFVIHQNKDVKQKIKLIVLVMLDFETFEHSKRMQRLKAFYVRVRFYSFCNSSKIVVFGFFFKYSCEPDQDKM